MVLEELAECIGNESDILDSVITKELEISICTFVRRLSDRDRNLFIRRYFFTEKISDIAKKYQLSENNVTVILSRIRTKLRKKLAQEGYLDEQTSSL